MTYDEVLDDMIDEWLHLARRPTPEDLAIAYWKVFPEVSPPMSEAELDQLEAWVDDLPNRLGDRLPKTAAPQEDLDIWAKALVDEVMEAGDETAVSMLLNALLQTADTDRRVNLLGAGPVEDLVNLRGMELLAMLKDLSATNLRMRIALRWVWVDEGLPPDVDAWLKGART